MAELRLRSMLISNGRRKIIKCNGRAAQAIDHKKAVQQVKDREANKTRMREQEENERASVWDNMLQSVVKKAESEAKRWLNETPEGKSYLHTEAKAIRDQTTVEITQRLRVGVQNVPGSEWETVKETSLSNGSVAWSNKLTMESYRLTEVTLKVAERIAGANYIAHEKNRVSKLMAENQESIHRSKLLFY